VRRWIFLTQSGELPDTPISGANPEAREATARMYKILAGVSAEDRTLFVTRYVEKMEMAEIAAAIGRPLSTTKRRLARATRRITARMSGDPRWPTTSRAWRNKIKAKVAGHEGRVIWKASSSASSAARWRATRSPRAIGMPAPGAAGPLAEDVARVLTRRPRRKLRPAWKWAPALGGRAWPVLVRR
jgi:hypothetical protein